MMGVFFNSGQVCVRRHPHLRAAATCTMASSTSSPRFSEAMTTGRSAESQYRLGPLVSKEQFDRVKNYLEIGKKEGAGHHRWRKRGRAKATS